MAIKKLQNDFTTPEQSKRLLELGVPEWAADCVTSRYGGSTFFVQECQLLRRCIDSNNYIPCWSVGRLIRVVNVCCTDDNVKDEIAIEVMYSNKNSAQLIIEMMSEYAYVMDFSKLEE